MRQKTTKDDRLNRDILMPPRVILTYTPVFSVTDSKNILLYLTTRIFLFILV